MRKVFAFIACGMLVAAAAAAPASPAPAPVSMALAVQKAEALIAQAVADARAQAEPGAPKLLPNGELDRIAKQRSQSMADGIDPFAHEDSQGRKAATEMMRDRISPYGAFGENLMYELRGRMPFDPARFAKSAVEGWLASEGHRANIMSHEFDRSGVGVAVNGTTAYATQVFMGPPKTAPRPQRAR